MLTSCEFSSEEAVNGNNEDNNFSDKDILKADQIETLDTIIKLSEIKHSNHQGASLTEDYAKKILYKHFAAKGFFTSDNLPSMEELTENDNEKLSVEYKGIFIAGLNNNEKLAAVITYWLTPPYASGHCYQPHKAIILDTGTGYIITNEEFIPENYLIDSLNTKHGLVTIFGYYYDCVNHTVVKKLKIGIK